MANTKKVMATASGLYVVKDGKTFECPVNKEFELDEDQANKLAKTKKLVLVTNKDKAALKKVDNGKN